MGDTYAVEKRVFSQTFAAQSFSVFKSYFRDKCLSGWKVMEVLEDVLVWGMKRRGSEYNLFLPLIENVSWD